MKRLRQEAVGAKLMRHELNLARDVQARLLPENPTGVHRLGVCWLLPACAIYWW